MVQPTPLEALLDCATRTPDAVAFIIDNEPWTCLRLAIDSAKLADALRSRSINAGDRVALHMFNLPELVLAYPACWRVGAIAVPLNARYKEPELTDMIERIRPALYLGQDALYQEVRQISPESLAPEARFIVGLEETDGTARTWPTLFAGETPRSPQDALECPLLDSEAPAVLLATSGTTGRSKLVVWTQRMMAAFSHTAESRGMGAADISAISMPMMHASGICTIATCLLTGTLGIILERFDADAVLEAIEKYRCTRYAGLPFMLAELVRCQQAKPRDVASLLS